jgi:hypothetical protein
MTATAPVKVIVAVTFREFNGSENEKIQRLFIESIRNQTYSHWRMIVSVFNERLVADEIGKYDFDSVVYQSGPANGYRFSLTDVLLNGIQEAVTEERAIVLWTTCDVIFPADFFEQIVANATPGFFAVSHPHVTYASRAKLGSEDYHPASINSGMDIVIMDSAPFRVPENLDLVRRYRYVDWGIFEHFLVGVAKVIGGRRINLFPVAKIAKIENDREVGAETTAWLLKCWERNKVVLERFIDDFGLSRQLLNLTYCHMQFELLGSRRAHYLSFGKDYYRYFTHRLREVVASRVRARVNQTRRQAT